jgi:Peptidase_C39 like family
VNRAAAQSVLASEKTEAGAHSPSPASPDESGAAAARDQAGHISGELSRPSASVAGVSRRTVILAGAALLVITVVIVSAVMLARGGPGAGSGPHQPSGTGLSMQKPPWATTVSKRAEQAFAPGSPIRYAFEVYNSTGAAVSANIRFDAYWGTIDDKHVNIKDILFQETIPPGRETVYSPLSTVPSDALPGIYSEQADIADRNDPADRAGQYSSFDVTGRKLLSVPYLAQAAPARPGGEADGPACVAMILKSRPNGEQPTVREVQDFITSSVQNQTAAGAASPVAGKDLEYALARYGIPEAAISQISLKENGLPQAQVTKIAIAIKQGSPVITYTDGKDLPAGPTGSRSYTGHWLVVVGFDFDPSNGTEVLVNDPDATPGHGGIKDQPIGIGIFEQALADDASMPAAQQEPNDIAGITVALTLSFHEGRVAERRA